MVTELSLQIRTPEGRLISTVTLTDDDLWQLQLALDGMSARGPAAEASYRKLSSVMTDVTRAVHLDTFPPAPEPGINGSMLQAYDKVSNPYALAQASGLLATFRPNPAAAFKAWCLKYRLHTMTQFRVYMAALQDNRLQVEDAVVAPVAHKLFLMTTPTPKKKGKK